MSGLPAHRITLSAAAAHYGRSHRWVRLHIAVTGAAQAALSPGTAGPRHERDYDRLFHDIRLMEAEALTILNAKK